MPWHADSIEIFEEHREDSQNFLVPLLTAPHMLENFALTNCFIFALLAIGELQHGRTSVRDLTALAAAVKREWFLIRTCLC